jgi:methylated-DNA-[protein]-cysteine S-methyltransferase
MNICGSVFSTPLGWCGIVAGEKGLKQLVLPLKSKRLVIDLLSVQTRERSDLLTRAEKMIRDYFNGKLVSFDLPLDRSGFSPFQEKVYAVTRMIPYGRVKTYGEIAREMGIPGASRAVGTALGQNPLPLFIPCHRVVRGDGGLGGFSSPEGTAMKAKLLQLEGVVIYPKTGQTF